MNIKYICVISIIVIAMIGIGCVDKTSGNASTNIPVQSDSPTVTDTNVPTDNPTVTDTNVPIPEVTSDVSGKISSNENISTTNLTDESNVTPEETDKSGNVVTDTSGNVAVSEVTDTPDSSVTEIFKIGEEKNMLGANIRLVNITNYDNNSIVISIDGVEYKYDSETTVQAKGLEIVDVISSEDAKTAEITVDHISQ